MGRGVQASAPDQFLKQKEGDEMTFYKLYLESGPKRKKTMVHVLDLLGCIATGPTTEEALEKTPEAIREYLRFLQRHGTAIDSDMEVQMEVAEHITEGEWLGNGSYSLVFQPDLEPLTSEELEKYILHLQWSRSEMLALVAGLSEEQLEEKPQSKGRPIRAILEHVFGAEYAYVRTLGKLEGVRGPGSVEQMPKDELLVWMERVRSSEIEKLRSLSLQERSEVFIQGKQTRTARRVMRRMLEHEWEHLLELKERLEVSV
jgi:predicted RNase H-like HicB family nuclease/uncharacterized damage-inducible protein DinB